MKSKGKLTKRIAITLISIVSILTLSMSNSMFIRESNPYVGFDSNINNELIEPQSSTTHSISDYDIVRLSQSGNEVTYKIDYSEEGVWYWDQKKEDYVKKSWGKYAYDDWYYGPNISLGSSGDDDFHTGSSSYAPTFTIKYTGDRPSHEVYHPEIPDDPDTSYNEHEDAWTETVYDNWPNPSNAFKGSSSGWILQGSYNPSSNQSYTYKWSNYNSKATFPSLNKHWEFSSKDDGNWTQCTYNHWDWTGTDYWKNPVRAKTGLENQKVYVDWEIYSNDILIDSGREDVGRQDVVETTAQEFAASQTKPTYPTATDSQKHSSTPPSITVPEPKDSAWYGTEGSKTFTINNLPLGWEFVFNADLMYVDSNGQTQLYDSFEDTFTTSKTFQGNIELGSYSDNETTVGFTYDVIDPKNLRESPVHWEARGDKGFYQTGESYSNHFNQTFDVTEGETVEFSAWYDYSLSFDNEGKPDLQTSTIESISQTTGVYYEDKVTKFEIWVNDIQDSSFVFNYYIATNNNFLPPGSQINISFAGNNYTITDAQLGTQSFLVDLSSKPELNDVGGEVVATLTTTLGESIATTSLNTTTNLVTPFTMRITENTYIKNTEAGVEYIIDPTGLSADEVVDEVTYELNGAQYELDWDGTTTPQYIDFENLKANTEYTLQFEAKSNIRTYYSNVFKFTTDRNPKIYLPSNNTTVGEHSAAMTFEVDKYEYLDTTDYTWDIIDKENDKVLYETTETISNNGSRTLYADGLQANHEYRFVMNAVVEEETIMLYSDVKTSREENDTLNNSYITSVSKTGSNSYSLGYKGKAITLQYSYDGDTWTEVEFKQSKGKLLVEDVPTNDEGFVVFRLNGQMRSQTTYYDGVESTLIKPRNPIDVEATTIVWIVIIAFVLITIISASTWAYIHSKKEKERVIEGNIWKQE